MKNIENKVMKSLQKSFKIYYFLYILDKTITTVQNRFEQFKIYEFFLFFI